MNISATVLAELPHLILLALTVVGIGVGVLIGSVGVGGILLVPALIYLAGIDIHVAIASSLFSYAFSGITGAWLYARRGSIQWSSGLWLCAGAMPGAWFGATVVNRIDSDWLVLVIALFIVFSAFNSIRSERQINRHSKSKTEPGAKLDGALPLLALGLATGVGSALSGSGGPLVLVPSLVWLGWPVLTAVGLGQLIQIPVSLLADVANVSAGAIDLPLGLGIAATVSVGVMVGARIAHRVPAASLRKLVITALLIAATWMVLQGVVGLATPSPP